MTDVPSSLLPQLEAQLMERRAQLRGLLQAAAGAALDASERTTGARDFKEAAANQADAAVEDAALASATRELAQVEAALRRLHAGDWGHCEECGDPIAAPRLLAMPTARFCAPCQARRERHRGRRPMGAT